MIGFVVSAGTGCGYFIGGGVEYELRIGTAIIDAVADLGAVAAGTTVDDNGLSPAVLLCQGEDGITYFNDELLSDDGRPVEGDVVVRGGWGVSGELTDASCPETRLGAEARRIETESFFVKPPSMTASTPAHSGTSSLRYPREHGLRRKSGAT